jgi:cytoplasmic polyadenylation element-binding protein
MDNEKHSKSNGIWFGNTGSYANKFNTCSTETIRDSNSNSNLFESTNELFWRYRDNNDRTNNNQSYNRDRANTIAIQRPITNKSDSNSVNNPNSLPNHSILNDNQNLLKFDASFRFNCENVKSDPIYSNDKQRDYNGFCDPYFGGVDQKELNLLTSDILSNRISNRDDNKDEIRTNPQNAKNHKSREPSDQSFMENIFNENSFSLKNSCKFSTNLFTGSLGCSLYFNDQIWQSVPKIWSEPLTDHFQDIIQKYKMIAKKVDASYTWSGQLPKRNRNKNPIYSCKVFLGGIPYDLTDSDLHLDFARFGPIQIQWPAANVKSAIEGAVANKAGYVYVIFDSYDHVTSLLNACTVSYKDLDSGCRWYFNMNSRRTKMKEVQVIPFDIGDRFFMKSGFHGQMDHSKTVFVGALHGMLSADGLAKVMEDLFGGVIFAGLDTDKHKYPLGSGRVSFDSNDSYMKAVSAAFVEIKSSRFKKKIQIDPYIENESICYTCKIPQQSPVFCRDIACFQYYCRNCWDVKHSDQEFQNHRPIIKNKIK